MQGRPLRVLHQADTDVTAARPGVADHVGQGLLRDAVRSHLDGSGQPRQTLGAFDRDAQAVISLSTALLSIVVDG